MLKIRRYAVHLGTDVSLQTDSANAIFKSDDGYFTSSFKKTMRLFIFASKMPFPRCGV